MVLDHLPSVLYIPNGNSLSMERALKQVLELLEQYPIENHPSEDMIQVSIDDIQSMLSAIRR